MMRNTAVRMARSAKRAMIVVALVSGLSTFDATAAHAQTPIRVCINNKTHAERLIPTASSCKKTETLDIVGGDGWSLTGNAGTSPGGNFLGTIDNQPLEFHVNGSRVMRYEPAGGVPNVIGGFSGNIVLPGIEAGTIAGGGTDSEPNQVTATAGTVGGGINNIASAPAPSAGDPNPTPCCSTVGGGAFNTANGDSATVPGGVINTASGNFGTVGGGSNNTASGDHTTVGGGSNNIASLPAPTADDPDPSSSTVAGGLDNLASGDLATVAGGLSNLASGLGSMVPGGQANIAAGFTSFAAGDFANAQNDGAFVWADSIDDTFSSTQDNQFIARATGGFDFVTVVGEQGNSGCFIDATGTPAGNLLCTGKVTSTGFNVSSDRAMKTGFHPIAAADVLTRVAALPVSSWTFKGDNVRHIGPMAQDFHAAFKVGEDDKHISLLDEGGIALAAIQGLYHEVKTKDAQLAEQAQQIKMLTARLEKLERVTAARDAGSDVHPAAALQPPRGSRSGAF